MTETTNAKLSTTDVRTRIAEAIVSHRLLPRTKLGEEKLAAALNTTRARVREALARLEVERMVVSEPNRGMFVAAPSIEEARQTLAARRLLESETTRLLAARATQSDIAVLRDNIEKERRAWEAGARARAIGLSRHFHQKIAELSGNAVLAELLGQITARVALAIALYDRPSHPDCMFDEHIQLVDAIEQGDAQRAVDLMVHHIDHMVVLLDSYAEQQAEPNLAAIFNDD